MTADTVLNFERLLRSTEAHSPSSADRTRRFALDALAGLIAIAAAALARIGIEAIAGGVAPFVLTFPAVMIATLARGGGGGAIAALGCQVLTIRYVFPHWLVSHHGGLTTDLTNVVLSTLALAGTVWATSSYRRTAGLLRSQCQRQVDTLLLLMTEMDHRTKNNFQIAAGLLAHQAVGTLDVNLAHELERASRRLETIASVYQDLSIRQTSHQPINLAEHLKRIIDLLRDGATPAHVLLRLKAVPIELPVQTSIIVGLIVNEWVMNALKYAFGDGPGRIDVDVTCRDDFVNVVVRDDGSGPGDASGQGSAVIASLAEVIDGVISSDSRGGTWCVLRFPKPFCR